MRTKSAAAALALASLHSKDPTGLENTFRCLDDRALKKLDRDLIVAAPKSGPGNDESIEANQTNLHDAVAEAAVRRVVYYALDRFKVVSELNSTEHSATMDAALRHHALPDDILAKLDDKYGNKRPGDRDGADIVRTYTWYDALERLREVATDDAGRLDRDQLWKLILDHPMTAYAPISCPSCGLRMPTAGTPPSLTKKLGGLSHLTASLLFCWEIVLSDYSWVPKCPTRHLLWGMVLATIAHVSSAAVASNGASARACPIVASLEDTSSSFDNTGWKFARGGWKIMTDSEQNLLMSVRCPRCKTVSHCPSFPAHPQTLLDPKPLLRLCGHQELLRLHLARYIGVELRMMMALDWDHVWTEYMETTVSVRDSDNDHYERGATIPTGRWTAHGEERNFAVRLDEGIGSWTHIFAISPIPEHCCDATQEYLRCSSVGGRLDENHATPYDIQRWLEKVADARRGAGKTQLGTLNGYAILRAGWSTQDVTAAIKKAVADYGKSKWWEL